MSEVAARSPGEAFAQAMEGFEDMKESFRKIREGEREIAGMKGEEMVTHLGVEYYD